MNNFLIITGKLNNETVSKMKAPRCGFKDIENPESARNNSMFQKFVHIGKHTGYNYVPLIYELYLY